MADVLVRAWIERVDDRCSIACAEFREVYRGQIFGCGTILLFDPRDGWYRSKDRAVEKLKTEIVRGEHIRQKPTKIGGFYYVQQHNKMPLIGQVRDVSRA